MPALPDGTDGALALALVGTIAHDGHGGIADGFGEDAGVAGWLAEHFPGLPPRSHQQAERLRALRSAARVAFAAAVPAPASGEGERPGSPDGAPAAPPSADQARTRPTDFDGRTGGADPLPPTVDQSEAAELLTAAIAALDARLTLGIDAGGVQHGRATDATGQPLLEGLLALAVLDFLTGPLAPRLRSCQAPRCVRYFVQGHGRQHWCKTSCGNRARAARFAQRHR